MTLDITTEITQVRLTANQYKEYKAIKYKGGRSSADNIKRATQYALTAGAINKTMNPAI